MVPSGAFLIRCREGDDDDVPLRRDLAEREGGTRGAVAGPVADEPMAVRRAAHRDRRDRGLRRCGRTTACARTPTACRARLGRVGERLRVREAVSTAETLKGAGIPGQQGYVLQVIGGSVHMGDKGLRCGDIVLGVGIGGFEKEVGGGDARATAAALVSGTHPTGEGVSRNFDVAAVEQGIVQGIVDELPELLSERLHVTVFDNGGCGMEIRAEHEGVSGGGVDAVRSPGAAHRCVAIGVVSGVMRHGDDELAFLFGKLLEEFLLQKLDVDDGEGAAGLLRGEDVAVADGDGDLYRLHLWLAEQRMPPVSLGEGGAQHGVGILCGAAGGEGELGEDGRAEDARYVRGCVHDEGLAGGLLRVKGERDGNEHCGDGGGASLCRIAADESVGALAGGHRQETKKKKNNNCLLSKIFLPKKFHKHQISFSPRPKTGFLLFNFAPGGVVFFPKFFFSSLPPPPPSPAGAIWTPFLARPIGSALFGHFGDRIGRKTTLVVALSTMGLSTVAIGALPTYHTIGFAAPLLLALCRFGQGLGLGGEWGGAVLLAIENAPPNKRAWYGMFPQLGAPIGFFFSGGVFLLLSRWLTDEQFFAFGWRLAIPRERGAGVGGPLRAADHHRDSGVP